MELLEIKRYIKNWEKYLQENRIKGLSAMLKNYEFFDFQTSPSLGNDSEYLHAYIGISSDFQNIKLFIISDQYDRKVMEDNILEYISIINPTPFKEESIIKEIILDHRAKKRINRWKKDLNSYLSNELSEDCNLVRCFKIPTEDLLDQNHRAYFGIKKARTNQKKDYRLDLIIKNMDKSTLQEVELSYDTIRLVPPFPPTTRNYFLLEY